MLEEEHCSTASGGSKGWTGLLHDVWLLTTVVLDTLFATVGRCSFSFTVPCFDSCFALRTFTGATFACDLTTASCVVVLECEGPSRFGAGFVTLGLIVDVIRVYDLVFDVVLVCTCAGVATGRTDSDGLHLVSGTLTVLIGVVLGDFDLGVVLGDFDLGGIGALFGG